MNTPKEPAEALKALKKPEGEGPEFLSGQRLTWNSAIDACIRVLLAQQAGWRPISEFPEDLYVEEYIGIIEYAPGKFGQPFACYEHDTDGHRSILVTELRPHRPTHFLLMDKLPLPAPPAEGK
jgi:hypothetical protein